MIKLFIFITSASLSPKLSKSFITNSVHVTSSGISTSGYLLFRIFGSLFFKISFNSGDFASSCSFNCRLSILPVGDFGISSTNVIPPRNFLWGETFSFTNSANSSSVMLFLLTTKPLGSSPASSSGIPMTAASCTSGCERRIASSSAGATCGHETVK